MHYAVFTRNFELLIFLQNIGADCDLANTFGITPLILAAIVPWINGFAFLAAMTKDLNVADKLGNSALHYAVAKNHHAIVELLLSKPGINV